MDWYFGLDGRRLADLQIEKQHFIRRNAEVTEGEWRAFAAVALEVIGLREAVRLGDPRLWRQAVSEIEALPLPPLNLPLPMWDLYQAHPFVGVTLHMSDGQQVSVADWSNLYYSWHARWFAVREDKVVKFYDATLVDGGESIHPPTAQTTILERLLWLQRAEKPVDFFVRTRKGKGFVVQGTNSFRLDQSGALLVLKRCPDQPLEILPLSDILSVVLANNDPKQILEQLKQRLVPTPFLPFHVVMLYGGHYTVNKSQNVLVTSDTLFLAQGTDSHGMHESVLDIPLAWIERFDILPS